MPGPVTEPLSLSAGDLARDDARVVLEDQAELVAEDARLTMGAQFDLGAVDIFPAAAAPGQPIALSAGLEMIPIGPGSGLPPGFVPGLGPSGPVSPPPLPGVRGWGLTPVDDTLPAVAEGPAAGGPGAAASAGGELAEGAELGTEMAEAVSQGAEALGTEALGAEVLGAEALGTGTGLAGDLAGGLAAAPAGITEVAAGIGVIEETGGTVLVLTAVPGVGWAILGIVVGTVIVAGIAYLVYRHYEGGGTVPRSLPGAGGSGPLSAPGTVARGPLMLPAAPSLQPMRLPGEAAPPMTLPGQYEPAETYQTAVTSRIHEDDRLVDEAVDATEDQLIQRDLNNLQEQLGNGNMNPGLGNKRLPGTDIIYARGRNGGRLFFRLVDGNIEIVGKASKENEQRVIDLLREIYGR